MTKNFLREKQTSRRFCQATDFWMEETLKVSARQTPDTISQGGKYQKGRGERKANPKQCLFKHKKKRVGVRAKINKFKSYHKPWGY